MNDIIPSKNTDLEPYNSRPASKPIELKVFLFESPWLQMLPEHIKDRVIEDCHEEKIEAKQMVAHKGDASSYFIGVVDGLLKVSTVTERGQSLMFMAVSPNTWMVRAL